MNEAQRKELESHLEELSNVPLVQQELSRAVSFLVLAAVAEGKPVLSLGDAQATVRGRKLHHSGLLLSFALDGDRDKLKRTMDSLHDIWGEAVPDYATCMRAVLAEQQPGLSG